MAGLALLFTPVFTLGLGDVPMHLYSHGSSMLGTIQQVAGAIGTALVITPDHPRARSAHGRGGAGSRRRRRHAARRSW